MKCRGMTSPQARGNGTALPNPTRPDTLAPRSCTHKQQGIIITHTKLLLNQRSIYQLVVFRKGISSMDGKSTSWVGESPSSKLTHNAWSQLLLQNYR